MQYWFYREYEITGNKRIAGNINIIIEFIKY